MTPLPIWRDGAPVEWRRVAKRVQARGRQKGSARRKRRPVAVAIQLSATGCPFRPTRGDRSPFERGNRNLLASAPP
jgi:hypothetical protein